MDTMKNYRQLIKELPSKTVVFTFGRFNPPTTGHELLIKAVKKLASSNKADHCIYVSKTQDSKKNPLSVDKKIHYLNLMFSKTSFVAANPQERTFIEAAKSLNKRYKSIIMVAGSDRVQEYEKILNKYNGSEFNFDTIQVISAGERDPDSDDASGMSATKMRALASKGDYNQFKKGLPSSLRDIDGRRLMNDIRVGLGLDIIKEQVKFSIDELRDKYFKGEIYHVGEIVESNGIKYEIMDRGSNYLVVIDSTGNMSRKWIQDVVLSEEQIEEDVSAGPAPREITFKGYTTKNFHHSVDAAKAFQDTIMRAGKADPVAVLNAIKATDTYMKINDMHLEQGKAPDDSELAQWRAAHNKAKESLDRVGEFLHHEDYWHMHGHEIEGLEANYTPETAGAEMADSYTLEGNMIPEELTNKTLKPTDTIKVARIIATMLGIENVESTVNPENLVNVALRKVRNKTLNNDGIKILDKMLTLATEVGIKYDTSLVPNKLKEEGPTVTPINTKKKNNISKDIISYSDYKKLNSVCEDEKKDTESDIDAEKQNDDKQTQVGGSMHAVDPGQDHNLRRRKIKYQLGEDLEEAHKIGDKVTITKGSESGTVGHIGEIRHGSYKGAPKTYTIFHGENGATQVKKEHIKAVKEEIDLDESDAAWAKSQEIQREKEKQARISDKDKHTLSKIHALLAKEKKPVKEEIVVESHVEFRLDHREKVSGDAKTTMSDHEAKVSDQSDKATYIKVPKHKADSFKSAMKHKHGATVELSESNGTADKHWNIAQTHKEKATRSESDPEKFHHHMANYHDSMASYHDQTGRNNLADSHAQKAEIHHEKAIAASKKKSIKEDVDQETNQNLEDQMQAELDLTDEQIDQIIDTTTEEEYLEVYEDDELAVIDSDTGEEIEEEVNEQALTEVLSRIERMRAKVRFAKTKAKRERRAQIALKSRSSNKTVNKRARRLAINLMKKRLLRGRNINNISVGEKERIERVIQKRKAVINRVAMKLAPRVRQIEKARLSHTKFTKGGSPNVTF